MSTKKRTFTVECNYVVVVIVADVDVVVVGDVIAFVVVVNMAAHCAKKYDRRKHRNKFFEEKKM